MSKKRNGQKAEGVLSAAEFQQTSNLSAGGQVLNWWRVSGRNNKWLAFGIIAFLSIGALGATLKYLEEDAAKQKRLAVKDRSVLSALNPFIPAPLPSATPQLSKEYIYAGSRLLAVEDANANAAPPADLAVWRPSTGVWWVRDESTGWIYMTATWGDPTDKPAPGDYDGDGRTDFSVFRPGTNQWYIIYSSNNSQTSFPFGADGDLRAQADYDGDGKTDAAVYRPSTYVWYIQGSTAGYYTVSWTSSVGSGIPASADYDGDGKADLALWRSGDSTFYSVNSGNQNVNTITMSQTGEAVSADYDGDGKADHAIRSGSNWIIRKSSNLQTGTINWQQSGDTAVQNDYDGDGKVDIATWRDSNGYWYIRQSATANSLRTVGWGQSQDIPVPAFYRR